MFIARRPQVRLSAIATAVLALEAAGNCGEPGEGAAERLRTVRDDELQHLRDSVGNDDPRGDWACDRRTGGAPGRVHDCEAVGRDDDIDAAWASADAAVTMRCKTIDTLVVFCTGRRPQGHREADIVVQSRATWFAVHAHLERAAVTAFGELAEWLTGRGAPAPLVARCRDAAADEVRHARALEALARRDGAEVPPPCADPPADDLFAVACHNAVEGCVSEAFAAVVAAHQAAHARSLELRALFSRIAADELRHGQLAWDLHAWLWDRLAPAQQAALVELQVRALTDLPEHSREAAAATPRELGWPGPDHAARMAELFARRLRDAAGLAA